MEDEIKNQDIIDFRYKLIEFGCAKSYLVSGVSCNDGHSHDSLEYQSWGKSMDVGVDSAARILGKPYALRGGLGTCQEKPDCDGACPMLVDSIQERLKIGPTRSQC